jgi:hypothetical protein
MYRSFQFSIPSQSIMAEWQGTEAILEPKLAAGAFSAERSMSVAMASDSPMMAVAMEAQQVYHRTSV